MSASSNVVPRVAEEHTQQSVRAQPRVCFVGMGNLPVLAREYNSHPIGGEQIQQTLLAKAFAHEGYSISMVTADYGQADGATWDAVRTHKAYALDEGLPVLRFFHPRWSGLWSALRRADADVYYTSCGGALTGQIVMFCRLHRRKVIFRVASDADCESELPLIKYWRDKKLYEYGLRRADAVVVQSCYQQELLRRNFGIESSVAGMLVEAGDAERSFEQRDRQVIWVNNFRSLKRPDALLAAADALPQVSFHMVGGAAPGYQQFFETVSAQARMRANVSLHGQIPYHNVNPFYERARVCVNTSDIEGFPNSYLQAWARGTPVVAFFDPDGLIEREGLGVAARDQETLASAIELLATNESAWLAMSARCRNFMEREYAKDSVLTPYRKLFSRLGRSAGR